MYSLIVLGITAILVLLFGLAALRNLLSFNGTETNLALSQFKMLQAIAALLMGFYLAGIGIAIAQFFR